MMQIKYMSRSSRANRSFPALEWLANWYSHISNRREQMVRYYGYYSCLLAKKNGG